MAAVFTVLFIVGAAGFGYGMKGYLSSRGHRSRLGNRYLPVVILFGVLIAYLVAKLIYEEVIPCTFVDDRYCDFDSTQYWNLFGWES